jgi:hypothetical protein
MMFLPAYTVMLLGDGCPVHLRKNLVARLVKLIGEPFGCEIIVKATIR